MLKLAREHLGPHASRVTLHEGYTATSPAGPFDGATCLLTLHFLTIEERRHTLAEIHKRLRPGAPLIVAHHSFPQTEPEKTRWLERYAAFAIASGIPAENATKAAAAIHSRLPILAPEQDAAMLEEAGFSRVELFYAGFSFRGWACEKFPRAS
jgi:tRNA (cmo5U34)-methyltransferase